MLLFQIEFNEIRPCQHTLYALQTRLHPQGKGGAKRPYSLTNRDYDSFNTTGLDDVTNVIERFEIAIMTQDEQDCHFLTVFGSVIWRSHE